MHAKMAENVSEVIENALNLTVSTADGSDNMKTDM